MDDYNTSMLSEAKNEYCVRLLNILTPLVIEGIKSILKEADQLCIQNDEESKYLMTFQNFLSRVPKWNNDIISEETDRIIKKSGCKGIIASAEEVKIIKKKYKNLFVVTPGIRFSDDNKNDQKRVFTPYEALIVKKADAIVMGRSLTKNIKNNLKKLIQSLN